METIFDCIIIGSGVSGMTAALYLKRYGCNIILLEKGAPGGQINQSSNVENYPGFIKIDGPSLVLNQLEQLKKLGIEPTYGNVQSIKYNLLHHEVVTDMGVYKGKTILLATGRQARKLGLPNENPLIGRGVSYCATCDGPMYKDKDVCVVGGGNSALEESLYLASICNKVTIIHRRDKFTADQTFIEKLKNFKNIDIKYNSVVSNLNEKDDTLNSITLSNGTEIPCSALFIYIGQESNIDYLKDININTEGTSIITENDMSTNLEGIYASGDAIKKDLYQLVTATSDGAIAASSIKKYLQSKGQ